MKGRIVFQGDQIRDANWDYVFFEDVASSSTSLQAGKCAVAYGMQPGYTVEQADALQAYLHTSLNDEKVTTWVRLGPEL